MEVAVYNDACTKPAMPIRGVNCAAPLSELRVPEYLSHLLYKWKMTDQHRGYVGVTPSESHLRLSDPGMTPCIST